MHRTYGGMLTNHGVLQRPVRLTMLADHAGCAVLVQRLPLIGDQLQVARSGQIRRQRETALVHLADRRRDDPRPGPLWDDALATDGFRASGRQHSVQVRHASRFHIAMRLQHAKQAASGSSTDTPGRMQAKAVIVPEVERLHWRIWNGKAQNARRTLERVRKVMHVFQGERSHRPMAVPSSRKLWHALREVGNYLCDQSTRPVNYAKRYRAGLRVGTSVAEGTANFLVDRRMNKTQQMRWSRRGADLLLQVRCAVFNGAFGSGFGKLFEPTSNTARQSPVAARFRPRTSCGARGDGGCRIRARDKDEQNLTGISSAL
jgi:hypothetical protein